MSAEWCDECVGNKREIKALEAEIEALDARIEELEARREAESAAAIIGAKLLELSRLGPSMPTAVREFEMRQAYNAAGLVFP